MEAKQHHRMGMTVSGKGPSAAEEHLWETERSVGDAAVADEGVGALLVVV